MNMNYFCSYQPSTCWNPVCYNVTGLCEGYEVCQPVPKLVFYPIDQVIVGIFTAQFVIRYLTVWAVDARYVVICFVIFEYLFTLYAVYIISTERQM